MSIPGSKQWSTISLKKGQLIPLLMLFNGSPTSSVNMFFTQTKISATNMTHNPMMTWKRFLLMNQNFKRKNYKEKPEAE